MKKLAIILSIIFVLLGVGVISFYFWGTNALSKEERIVNFIIEPGTSKMVISENLEKANLIRSKYALDLFLILNSPTIQAGEYELSPSMTPKEMVHKFSVGDVKINSVKVTLVEGQRLVDYATLLSEKFDFTKQEFLDAASDTDYLTSLITSGKYWFLTDQMMDSMIYYPLEGYLYPDTYEFLETAKEKDIINTILDHTLARLNPYKEQIENSGHSVHEILTMASIIEKEANTKDDRKKVSQVFYKRLESNMSLGSDVTTYYGVRKVMGEELLLTELNDPNPYNTRLTDGTMNGKLPIGPIASSDISSIEAALSPENTDYLYFVANVCTGKVFFQEDYTEFLAKARELQTICDKN